MQRCNDLLTYRTSNRIIIDTQPGRATITEPLSPQNVGNPFDAMSVDQITDAENEFDRIYERDPDGKFFGFFFRLLFG